MRIQVFFLILSSLFANDLVHAEESSYSFSGRVYSDQYFPTNPSTTYSSGIFQSSISAWLDFQAKLSKSTSFHTVGQLDAFLRSMAEPNESSFGGKLREAYLSFQNDSLELRAGQQIIPWGKSDGVNPTDYFTAKDYTLLNPDEEVKRTGAPSILLSFTPKNGTSPFNFTGVFQAYYPQTKLLIPDQAIPSGVQFQKYPFAPTPFQTETVEFGAKLSYLKNDFDFSFSAFRGMNHFAQYVYEIASNQIVPKNIQQTVFGGDVSFTFGDYVFRAETGYFIPDQGRENTDLYGLVQPTHLDSVAGIEHTFFDDFHAQVQVLYRYHVGYLNPSLYTTANPILTQIQQSVARSNGLLLNFQRQDNLGGTFRIGYANETSDWTADVFLFGYFAEGQDYLLRPQISYKLIEGLKFTAGGDFYGGDETRPLGALQKNSSVFVEGRYVF
jgi:hypothetical protein